MPIYEYTCRACAHDFEELVRSTDRREPVRCPACDSRQVERRLSVFSARHGMAASGKAPPMGPCGRCGDPDGPCTL